MHNICGKVTIYLVRHAQTAGNVGMKIMEPTEDILTDLGKIQTNLLGMHLSNIKFDYAFASDYGRALKTANGILKLSKSSSEIPIQPSERLREVNFGKFETTSYKETFAFCKSLNKSIFLWEFPGGESFPGAGQRILNFIEETCLKFLGNPQNNQASSNLNILLVGHSASIAFFLHALLFQSTIHKIIGLEKKDLKLMRNTGYLKFEVEKNCSTEEYTSQPLSLSFNFVEKYYTKHLDCIEDMRKDINPLMEFAKSGTSTNDYVGCIQQ